MPTRLLFIVDAPDWAHDKKTDSIARRLGGILAGAHAAGLAFAGAATSPHFAYGLRPLTAPILARRLVAAALDERRFGPSFSST